MKVPSGLKSGSFLVFVSATHVSTTAATTIRGVDPKYASKYAPLVDSDGLKLFACHTRHNSTTPKQKVPFDAINDGYCDCRDGSDEPGTEACAGQMQTMFYCQNVDSVPMYVYSSRVNDGICDCCDAGDEWKGRASCANTCLEEGRLIRKDEERRIAEMQKGLQRRNTLLGIVRGERQRMHKELERARLDLQNLLVPPSAFTVALDVTASQPKAIVTLVALLIALIIPLCILFRRWRCCSSGRSAVLSKVEIIRRTELLLQVPISRVDKQGVLGLGIEGSSLGGLAITSVDSSGLVGQWNSNQTDQVAQVRAGDRIIESSYTNSRGEEAILETPREILQMLKNVSIDHFELLVSASRGEAEVKVLAVPVTMQSFDPKTDVELREIEDGKAGMEVQTISPKVEEWNKQMRALGACGTQSIEPGDRLVFDEDDGVSSGAEVFVAKLRYPQNIRIDRFEVVIERQNAADRIGLHVQRSISSPMHMDVYGVPQDGLISRHNTQSSSTSLLTRMDDDLSSQHSNQPSARQVLPGDHLVSVNGKEGYSEMLAELSKPRVAMGFQRYILTSTSISAASARELSEAPERAKSTEASHVAPDILSSGLSEASTTARAVGGGRLSSFILASFVLGIIIGLVAVVLLFYTSTPDLSPQADSTDAAGRGAEDAADALDAGASDGTSARQAPDKDSPAVSEYAKWMEGADAQAANVVEETRASEVSQASASKVLQDSGSEAGTHSIRGFFEPVEELIRSACDWSMNLWSAAKGEVKHRDMKVTNAQARVRELELKVSKSKESDNAVKPEDILEGKCMSMHHTKFKYEICFFTTAKQDSTSLGKWRGWDSDRRVALFDDGQQCYGGPKRSLRVKMHCGADEKIVDVAEPSMCVYEATAMHPAACTEKELQDLMNSRGPRMPHNQEL